MTAMALAVEEMVAAEVGMAIEIKMVVEMVEVMVSMKNLAMLCLAKGNVTIHRIGHIPNSFIGRCYAFTEG